MSARRATSGGAAWIVTFGDLAALLLTFFVLTYSMSEVPPPQPPDLASWSDDLAFESAIVAGDTSDRSSETDSRNNQANIYVRSLARDAIERAGLKGRASTRLGGDGVEIIVRDISWSDSGATPALEEIARRVGELGRLAGRTLAIEVGTGSQSAPALALNRALVLMKASGIGALVGVRPALAETSVLMRLEPAA